MNIRLSSLFLTLGFVAGLAGTMHAAAAADVTHMEAVKSASNLQAVLRSKDFTIQRLQGALTADIGNLMGQCNNSKAALKKEFPHLISFYIDKICAYDFPEEDDQDARNGQEELLKTFIVHSLCNGNYTVRFTNGLLSSDQCSYVSTDAIRRLTDKFDAAAECTGCHATGMFRMGAMAYRQDCRLHKADRIAVGQAASVQAAPAPQARAVAHAGSSDEDASDDEEEAPQAAPAPQARAVAHAGSSDEDASDDEEEAPQAAHATQARAVAHAGSDEEAPAPAAQEAVSSDEDASDDEEEAPQAALATQARAVAHAGSDEEAPAPAAQEALDAKKRQALSNLLACPAFMKMYADIFAPKP